jgi:hypothetical protein
MSGRERWVNLVLPMIAPKHIPALELERRNIYAV